MQTPRASTQYNDVRGTSSATFHAQHRLAELAESLGLPEGQYPIGVRISRRFPFNRTDPVEDNRFQASTWVKILTVAKNDMGNQNLPDFFASSARESTRVNSYLYSFDSIDEVLDWFITDFRNALTVTRT